MPNRLLLVRIGHSTRSNRHKYVSTVQLHAGAVHAQEWLQKSCEQRGWPVANDPRLGLRATVSRVRGMLMARTHVGLRGIGGCGGGEHTEGHSEGGIKGGIECGQFECEEPEKFGKVGDI